MTTELKHPPQMPPNESQDELPSHKELTARKSFEFMETFIRANPDIYALPADIDEATCTRQVMDNILDHEEGQLEEKWGNRTYARCIRTLAWMGFFTVGSAGIAAATTMPVLTGIAAIANAALFIKHWHQEDLLTAAVKNREEFEVRRLLAEGVNPNCPLHTLHGNLLSDGNSILLPFKETSNKIARILLEKGFDPNTRDTVFRSRLTPLESAIDNLDTARVAMLIQHGATVGLFTTTGSHLSRLLEKLQDNKPPVNTPAPFFDILNMLLEQAGEHASHKEWLREMRLMQRNLENTKNHPFLPEIQKRLMQAMTQKAADMPVRLACQHAHGPKPKNQP